MIPYIIPQMSIYPIPAPVNRNLGTAQEKAISGHNSVPDPSSTCINARFSTASSKAAQICAHEKISHNTKINLRRFKNPGIPAYSPDRWYMNREQDTDNQDQDLNPHTPVHAKGCV